MSEPLFDEFALACACSGWPLADARLEAIHAAAQRIADWEGFTGVVKRHRISGLAYNALTRSGISLPTPANEWLASKARRVATQNLAAAVESARVQRLLDQAGIHAVFIKGISLAQLAYGMLSLKHSRDVDVLVLPDEARRALECLEANGYVVTDPARCLSDAQRSTILRFKTEIGLSNQRTGAMLQLHWHLTESPGSLIGVDARSPTQDVTIAKGLSVRTLATEDLFAYLCNHGAKHAWSRLKWLADLNALVAGMAASDVERLHDHALTKGAGICSGQALLLCHDLLGLRLSPTFADALKKSRRVHWLNTIVRRAMIGRNPTVELEDRPGDKIAVMLTPILIGGWRHVLGQLRSLAVGFGDIVLLPLPRRWQLLYIPLRPFLWSWRRWRFLFGHASWEGGRKRTRSKRY